MGLDMYLERIHRDVIGYKDVNLDGLEVENQKLYSKLRPYIKKRGTPGVYEWDSLWDEVGYWRKVNAIHLWFVENVQNDNDDCGSYEVSKEQLEELLDTVTTVLKSCKLIDGTNEKIVEDSSVAQELLPTTGGFFFGTTHYTEYYVRSLEYTESVLKNALAETDFSEYAIYYSSSW